MTSLVTDLALTFYWSGGKLDMKYAVTPKRLQGKSEEGTRTKYTVGLKLHSDQSTVGN